VKLITYLHLVPRSKNERSYTSTPQIRLHDVVLSLKKGTVTTYLYLQPLKDIQCFALLSPLSYRSTTVEISPVGTANLM
jgi:hypothetical protein